MQTTQQTFDLLALAWWQNPWYWLLCIVTFCVVFLGAALLYWYWRTTFTVQEKIVCALAQLRALPCATHEEQVRVYQYIFSAIKTHYHAAGFVEVPSLTDYELISFMRTQAPTDAFYPILFPLADEIGSRAAAIKFGQTTVAPHEVHAHIDRARSAFEHICAQTKKNKSSSRATAS